MAKKTDVKITASGIGGLTVVGMTISNSIGTIPTATIDIAPGPARQANVTNSGSGKLQDVDSIKRKETVKLSAEVKVHPGSGGTLTRKISFTGLLDGLNLSNIVGNNSYQLVVKNRAQRLLELTTITPGLVPASVNPYRHAGFNTTQDTGSDPAELKAWAQIQNTALLQKSPIKAYTEIMKWVLEQQAGGWETFLGLEAGLSGTAFKKVLGNSNYQKSAKEGLELLNSIDLSAVSGGHESDLKANNHHILASFGKYFIGGSHVVLENYMNFLSSMGCTILFSNNKMFVVPANSVLKQSAISAASKSLSSKPNQAYPSDYNTYIYNDNGYRDVGCVIALTTGYLGGPDFGALMHDRAALGEFCLKDSAGSGVLVLTAHPWMHVSATLNQPTTSGVSSLKNLDGGGGMVGVVKSFIEGKDVGKISATSGIAEKKQSVEKKFKNILDNYAETKIYQAKYMDRQGSVTMDFNPNWVPGTGGSLYVRETKMNVIFHVTNVTHRIDISAPNTGTAITTVSFNCARMGANPPGTSEDSFLGYNLGKEQSVQSAFIGDNS